MVWRPPAGPDHNLYLEYEAMADDDDTALGGNDNEDEELRSECSVLLFELRLGIEATVVGIQKIAMRAAAKPMAGELAILLRLIEQSVERGTLSGSGLSLA
jgi:hypothetical protein